MADINDPMRFERAWQEWRGGKTLVIDKNDTQLQEYINTRLATEQESGVAFPVLAADERTALIEKSLDRWEEQAKHGFVGGTNMLMFINLYRQMREENAAMRVVVEAVADDHTDSNEEFDYCKFDCAGAAHLMAETPPDMVQLLEESYYHALDCPAVLAVNIAYM